MSEVRPTVGPLGMWRNAALALAGCAAPIIGLAMYRYAAQHGYREDSPAEGLPLAVAFTLCGAVLIRYPRARLVGHLMLVCGLTAGASILIFGVAGLVWLRQPSVAEQLLDASAVLSFGAVTVAIALLPQVFPDGLLLGRRWRILAGATLGTGVVVVVALFASSGDDMANEAFWHAWIYWGLSAYVVGVVTMIVRWRAAAVGHRRQIAVMALVWLGFLLLVVADSVAPVFPKLESWPEDLSLMLWPPVTVAVVAISVWQFGLFEIRPTLRRLVAYGASLVAVTVLFAAVCFVLLAALSERLAGDEVRWFAVAMVTIVILVIEPVRRRTVGWLRRRFLGDHERALPALAGLEMSGQPEDNGHQAIVETVRAALHSPGVALRVQDHHGVRFAASTGDISEDAVSVPLLFRGEQVGEIEVSPRTPGEPFRLADLHLLQTLAAQASVHLSMLRRDDELAHVRRTRALELASERARLGRDLHDQMAPLLAGASLSAEALRRSMPPGSADEADASRLAQRLRSAAAQARQLAHELQPAHLDIELGAAIENHLSNLSGPGTPVIVFDVSLPAVPTPISEAAYLIVLEAVNNVVRHAAATQLGVACQVRADDLELTVTDDGCGIAEPYISGLGIASMRRRTEEFGGNLIIGSRESGGTVLRATIPLP